MRDKIVSAYREAAQLIPTGSKIVLFGSSLSSSDPTDIDVVIVYDIRHVDPKEAFTIHNDFIHSMASKLENKLHVIMLNSSEYADSAIKKSEAHLEL